MSHLLYSSNEMYSSTQLIRNSKTIFDKIINNEIDKAIILRDGKPSFMLLDFEKYEKIMAEYAKLKTKKTTKKVTIVDTKQTVQTKEPKKSEIPPMPVKNTNQNTNDNTKDINMSSNIEIPKQDEVELKEFWE